MEKVLSLAVAVYGAYLLYSGNAAGLTPMDLAKGLSAIIAGVGYFIYLNRGLFSTVVMPLIKLKPESKPKVVTDACVIFNPNDYEQKDFECLVHLRNRVTVANNVEGIQTCAKLNKIIFSLDTDAKAKAETGGIK